MDSEMRPVPSLNWNRTTLWQVRCGDGRDTSLWRGWYWSGNPVLRATPNTEEDDGR